MNAKSFNKTVQGANHIKINKICQDYSGSFYDKNCAIAVVCDGHGGSDYVRSDIGSKTACEITLENIKVFLSEINTERLIQDHDTMLRTLEASIIGNWNEAVNEHYNNNPFTEDEISLMSEKAKKRYLENHRIESAYGSTVIAVVYTKKYWFGLQIGDGKCVTIDKDGNFEQPIPWNSKCFLNATTSICDSDAIDNFEHYFYPNSDIPRADFRLPAAIFIGSDGVDDCFSNDEQLYNLYKTIAFSFSNTEFEKAKAELEDYLPRLSAKGSGDDISVAAILDIYSISKLSMVKNFGKESRESENTEEEKVIEDEDKKESDDKTEVYEEKQQIKRISLFPINSKKEKRQPKHCMYCGKKLNKSDKFCGNCGKAVTKI